MAEGIQAVDERRRPDLRRHAGAPRSLKGAPLQHLVLRLQDRHQISSTEQLSDDTQSRLKADSPLDPC